MSEQKEPRELIQEAAYNYDGPSHFNCYGCCQSNSDYEKAFKAGAKFILEMPELREALDFIKSISKPNTREDILERNSNLEAEDSYGNYDDCFTDGWDKGNAIIALDCRRIIESLKKAGLCE